MSYEAPMKMPYERFSVVSHDGTRLMVYRLGSGEKRWLLPPGLGTPVICWRQVAQAFGDKLTIVTWDLRGTFASQAPKDKTHYGVADHVQDAYTIASTIGWLDGKGFVTGGWSLGIETGLEFYRSYPEHVLALTLINGSFEHIFKSALGLPEADRLISLAVGGASFAAPLMSPASRYLLGREWMISFLTALGLLAKNNDNAFFAEVLRAFRSLDFGTYFKLMLAANRHSARDVLAQVKVPTLITAGSADRLTPLSIAHEMHEKIPTSELFIVPGGTHYTTVEYPELINLKLEQFFRTRVFKGEWD